MKNKVLFLFVGLIIISEFAFAQVKSNKVDIFWGPVFQEKKELLNDVIAEETNVEEIERFSFTVRLAIWVVRLHPTIKSLSLGEHELGVMIIFPILYAEAEQISELIGNEHFDTSELDKSLFSTKERPVMGIFDGIGKISKKEREYERQHNQKK